MDDLLTLILEHADTADVPIGRVGFKIRIYDVVDLVICLKSWKQQLAFEVSEQVEVRG